MDSAYVVAARALSTASETGASICLPFVSAFPVSHAAVSTLGRPFGSETVCASDTQAARLDELQLDSGVGPCWEAAVTGAPVIDADLKTQGASGWPHLREAIRETGIRSVYAFPLLIGGLTIGAVDLYATTPSALTPQLISRASALAGIVATQVVRSAMLLLPESDDDNVDTARYSRREVHQATGMIIAQMRVTADDAFALLRAHAFAAGRPVRDVAADVVARRIVFTRDRAADAD